MTKVNRVSVKPLESHTGVAVRLYTEDQDEYGFTIPLEDYYANRDARLVGFEVSQDALELMDGCAKDLVPEVCRPLQELKDKLHSEQKGFIGYYVSHSTKQTKIDFLQAVQDRYVDQLMKGRNPSLADALGFVEMNNEKLYSAAQTGWLSARVKELVQDVESKDEERLGLEQLGL